MSAPAKKGSDTFHVIHKVPSGDSPYVKAKHVQLIDKDPSKAISLFWAAINSGDRVDSALKDMAVVMKQLDRSDEAIEAIKSFRHLCPFESQEPLDNILLELYKRSGRIEDQIKMLEIRVKRIEEGFNFGGKRVKPARSQGKKIYMTIEQEYSRLLGNLAWACMQNNDFKSAEEHYRKALSLEADKNKQCNLAICLMHMNRIAEAKLLLHTIRRASSSLVDEEPYARSLERATEMLTQFEHTCPSARRVLLTPELQTQPKHEDRKKKTYLDDDSGVFARKKLAFGENDNENGVRNGEKVEKDNGVCFLTPKSKKSWADMVEEEEERVFSPQTQPWKRFNDENLNSNLMINEKGKFFVEDERVVDDDELCDCGNGIKMLKRKPERLQVFKDITSSS